MTGSRISYLWNNERAAKGFASGVSLQLLIRQAYGIEDNQIIGIFAPNIRNPLRMREKI